MKLWTTLVILAVMASLTGIAEAKKPKETAGLVGQVTAIDGIKLTVSSGKKKKKAVTQDVTCDDKTTVTRDGQAAKLADLKVGDYVTITPADGTPTSVTATTTAPSKKSK